MSIFVFSNNHIIFSFIILCLATMCVLNTLRLMIFFFLDAVRNSDDSAGLKLDQLWLLGNTYIRCRFFSCSVELYSWIVMSLRWTPRFCFCFPMPFHARTTKCNFQDISNVRYASDLLIGTINACPRLAVILRRSSLILGSCRFIEGPNLNRYHSLRVVLTLCIAI